MKRLLVFLFVFLFFLFGCQEREVIEVETVVGALDTPWAIDFLPGGEMIFTERGGKISLYDGEVRVLAKLPVSEVRESGLAGVAVDPHFQENPFVYVYYTYEEDGKMFNRVSRFAFDGGLHDEIILLDEIPSARFHDGGRLKFGPDGLLYITTGDAIVPSSAQNRNSLAGKILRMNKDGSIPSDNPFGNYVYSYGHRNPQGIAWDENGILYAAEHGPTKNDEVNVIEQGSNYGWPTVQCTDSNARFVDALRCFSEFTMAPAGIAIHGRDLYVAGLRGAQVLRIDLDTLEEEVFLEDLGRIRDVVVYDSFLYIATSNKDGRGFPKAGDDKILQKRFS